MSSTFKIPLLDDSGAKLREPGAWGAFGFSQNYQGELAETDRLIEVIRDSLRSESVGSDNRALLFSFVYALATNPTQDVRAVLEYAIELPASVRYICRIGMFDRTTTGAIQLLAFAGSVASLTLLPPVLFEVDGAVGDWATAQAVGLTLDIAAEKRLYAQIDRQFDVPGTSVTREQFDPQVLFYLLRLAHVRDIVPAIAADADNLGQLTAALDNQIFSYFLVNSRQIEGLELSGPAEASCAVVGHTALAMGLAQTKEPNLILESIEHRIGLLKDQRRVDELQSTLSDIRTNLVDNICDQGRHLNRALSSATSGEATEFVTAPLKLVFNLLGSVSGGIGKATSGDKSNVFSAVGTGFRKAADTVDAAPDFVSEVVNAGASAEKWTRDVISRFWPSTLFGSQAEQESTESVETSGNDV